MMILDGWGLNPSCEANAVCLAQTPNLDRLQADFATSTLGTSGLNVGLPAGQMGNSEVGHLNIGAGRIIYQELTRISRAIDDGSFFDNPVLVQLCRRLAASGGTLHLLGLLSDGGVHSHNSHLYALLRLARQTRVREVCVHVILDGRDTPPRSGIDYLAALEKELIAVGIGRVATISGRYWAMDRDQRWDRVERSYLALTESVGQTAASSAEAIAAAYAAGQGDEFVEPWIIDGGGEVADGDGVIFFNFRADRAREMTRALTATNFSGFERREKVKLEGYVCLTEYDENFNLPVAFSSATPQKILGEVVASAGLKQLRIAETEKYAHVTFFFNGGIETPFAGEERVLIPSPKDVATYDLKPEMSAAEVTAELLSRIDSAAYDLIVVNYANCDMVGHTGVLDAAIKAVETVDACVGQVVERVLAAGGALLISADHGNCEQMRDAEGGPFTAHTCNPVPLIFVDLKRECSLRSGILADLAPTLLELLNIPVPHEMAGTSLLVR
ncbi:2,3-bisphosphoglycerate-independent phosphoglycerate mutase [Geopsychrobacter electrodiphilus]|uniref:2,3-bisphosphoglycerate-independent phosphoglycerate mutase n=1 Tax=Geopsychrobacter electrodiphilus TaxID=225196 RepID=UPI0003700997